MNAYPRKSAGFSLLELMTTVVVLIVVMTVAVPNLREMIKNNRVTSQGNELIAVINYARNEALRRSDNVTVVFTSDGFSWTAEVEDPDGTGDEACAGAALRCSSYEQVALELATEEGEDQMRLVFNNRGYLTPFADDVEIAMQHENCAGTLQRRILTVRPTGQLESCRTDCDSTCNGDG